ncbi:hypothetical protein F5X98DRAFT_59270 [Xylaria grammica]|nr:hypothetical protein F5X98DRAFT_59270 [Xylaria grammica]
MCHIWLLVWLSILNGWCCTSAWQRPPTRKRGNVETRPEARPDWSRLRRFENAYNLSRLVVDPDRAIVKEVDGEDSIRRLSTPGSSLMFSISL